MALTACGGGGGGSATPGAPSTPGTPTPPPAPPPTITASYVKLKSDAGDYIGGGASYSYTQADAVLTVTANGSRLSVAVTGDQNWQGEFQLPNSYTDVRTGVYGGLTRYPLNDPRLGGISWSGEGRGCNTLSGSFTVKKVAYEGAALAEVELQFEQYCEGGGVALRGDVYWNAKDTTRAAGPAAIPATLWQPPNGATPATGSYVYLESQSGDFVGAGRTYLYTPSNATLRAAVNGGLASISVSGDTNWSGDFVAMSWLGALATGYYGGAKRYPFHNPTKGGLSWYGDGRGCNTLDGWFVVDRVSFSGTALSALDIRFEQRCDGGGPALRGKIHWDASDPTTPPGPVAPPEGLWQPADGVTPASGNYVYLESQPGDFIGQGRTYTYTQADSLLTAEVRGGLFSVAIVGDEDWSGDFQAMNTLGRLERGYYGDLQRYPFHNPVKGGMDWAGDGRGCNRLTGWFVVDDVVYSGTTLLAIDLRFEQHCENMSAALRGKIHWRADDPTTPPGVATPPPDLWQPAVGATPASGNYVYLESPSGDYIGQGGTYSYTQANAILTTGTTGARFSVRVEGDEIWNGEFQAMNSLSRLERGYYADLERYPFHNPVKGGLNWSGEGRGCNTLKGWFVVDDVVYSGVTLTSIDLRFEQRCEGVGAPLHGKIHWSAGDATAPPGPVVPPPTGLWSPAPGITPVTGNFVYLESQPGDYIGAGGNYLYTSPADPLTMTSNGARAHVAVAGWTGDFQAMNTLSRLEPGYYGDLERFPFHNPVKGGLDWTGQGRGCNKLTGWFVVDAVTYSGTTLTALDLRFEQHCEGAVPALRGQIRWRQ